MALFERSDFPLTVWPERIVENDYLLRIYRKDNFMKRKIEALFLSFAIAIGITLPVAAASETANGISVSDSEVCVGEEFTVTLNVPAAENADTAIIRVNFDSTAFTVTEWEPSLSGQVKNAGVDSKGVGFFLVNAANAQRAIDLSKGLALTAKIKVKDDAEIKDYTFDLVSASLSYWNEETFKDVELWTPTTTKVTVSVKPAPVPATGITLNQKTLTLVEGKTETLEATVSPENSTDKVVWKSSESGVATVDQTGKVTAVKAGTTVITATAGTKSASCEVTVTCAHKNTVDVAAKASTCKEQGNEAYTKCKDCGEIIKGSDKALPLVSHKGGEATCVKKAVCEVCGDEYGDYAPHTYGELIAEVGKTCTTDGIKAHFECSVCKKVFDESKKETTKEALKIAASHGDTEIKNAKEATTEEDGYTGDTYCKVCGEKIKDGEVIPKLHPVLTDTDTGITVEAEADVLPTGTLLVVEPVSAEAENESVFDITLTDLNGEKIQPNGKVSVKVPVPEKFKDTENLYVYRVEGEKYIYIESSIVDNQVVFEVDHFSTYVITAEKHEEVPDTGVDFGISMGALLLAGATAIIASKKAKK